MLTKHSLTIQKTQMLYTYLIYSISKMFSYLLCSYYVSDSQ